jgi:hypothetical protein
MEIVGRICPLAGHVYDEAGVDRAECLLPVGVTAIGT